jgi:hypothetical protein
VAHPVLDHLRSILITAEVAAKCGGQTLPEDPWAGQFDWPLGARIGINARVS